MRNTNEGDEQLTETLVIVSTDGKEVDDELLSDTSEVMIGPYLGEPLASQLDDTLIYQPSLLFEEDELIITSITYPPTDRHSICM